MGSLPAAPEAVRFGKYSLVARLATGGMAEILLARLHGAAGFEKLVCIKRILPHLARDQQFVAMFLDEARIAARITHPNVCQVFELGEIDGSYYIAMEYLEGVPLGCFRRHDYYGPLPAPQLVAGIAVQACEGLHHAHQLKALDGRPLEVVHRDVSPQNLFITSDGIVKVLDFGIAKIQDATVRTRTGALKGTLAYMAPEQLRNDRVDRRIDVFALGVALWETLTRRHLFKRATEFLTFEAIICDPIPEVCALRPDVPPALSSVIARALARDRDDRFATARALGEAIAAAIQPLSPPAIGEELARAFPAQLAEQAKLIRVARSGGALGLDADRGPAVGHGTDLPATPTTILADDVTPAVESRSTRRRSRRSIALAAAALAAGSAAAAIYMTRTPAPAEHAVVATRAAADGAAPSAPLPVEPAAAPMPATASDAGARDVPPNDAPLNNAPRSEASQSEASRPADRQPATRAPASRGQRPSGPPGFITIDMIDPAQDYATIHIDGKNHGYTPLSRIELAPGRHMVRAVGSSGEARDFAIVIESGKVAPTLRVEWKSIDRSQVITSRPWFEGWRLPSRCSRSL